MQTQPLPEPNPLAALIVADIANAISGHDGEAPPRLSLCPWAISEMIDGLHPTTVAETMLAAQCVMFHAAMTDAFKDAMGDDPEIDRPGARAQFVAQNNAFIRGFDRLMRLQRNPAAPRAGVTSAVAPEPPPRPEAEARQPKPEPPAMPMNRAARRQAARDQRRAQARSPAAPADPPAIVRAHPQVAASLMNPEAVAAIKAGDPERFAHAMGIPEPSEAYLAAARAPGSPFDRTAAGPWPDLLPDPPKD